jgi:hypothetical protein
MKTVMPVLATMIDAALVMASGVIAFAAFMWEPAAPTLYDLSAKILAGLLVGAALAPGLMLIRSAARYEARRLTQSSAPTGAER